MSIFFMLFVFQLLKKLLLVLSMLKQTDFSRFQESCNDKNISQNQNLTYGLIKLVIYRLFTKSSM